jgi:hypothetical protein
MSVNVTDKERTIIYKRTQLMSVVELVRAESGKSI